MKPAAILFASAVALATYALNASSNSGLPAGWSVVGEAPHLYAAELAGDGPARAGTLVMHRTENSHPYASAALVKQLPVQDYAGKQLRISLRLRAEGADLPKVGIYIGHGKSVHVNGVNAANLKTWNTVQSMVTLPRSLDTFNVGVNLHGPGRVQVDDLKIEVLGDAPADQEWASIRMVRQENEPQ